MCFGIWKKTAAAVTVTAIANGIKCTERSRFAAAAGACMQVPQRILMALGTLADQLTYPSVLRTGERTEDVEKQLQGLLDLVGIGYLVERCGTKQKESRFGAVLLYM